MSTRVPRTGSGRPGVGQTTLRQTGPSWAILGSARANPAMVFAIFSQHTGRILGTSRGRDRADAMGRVRARLHEFPGHRTTQDILLYPMMNLTPVQRWIATSGLGMIAL